MSYREVFVGNLPATATEDDIRTLFYSSGAVESVELNQVKKALTSDQDSI